MLYVLSGMGTCGFTSEIGIWQSYRKFQIGAFAGIGLMRCVGKWLLQDMDQKIEDSSEILIHSDELIFSFIEGQNLTEDD